MRVDLQRREIRASVTELAREPGPVGWLRQASGLAFHRAYRAQRERDVPGFRAEVPVALERSVDGFLARVRGRADGVLPDGTVEEVKSADAPRAAHYFQLRLYLLALQARRGRLVLRDRTIDVAPGNVGTELDRRLRAAAATAQRRATLAREVRFPYPPRPGQEQLVERITRGLEECGRVLVHAPTGTGKTVCTLIPALRFALARNAQLFFATAKGTQQELAARTIRDLGLPLFSVTLRARERMCLSRTRFCEACPGAREAAVQALLDVHVPPERIRAPGCCPYALSLALARASDVVIGDYNYVYGPAAPPRDPLVVVVDEAHNLFDRARAWDSPFLVRASIPADGEWFARLRSFLDTDAFPFPWDDLADDALQLVQACPPEHHEILQSVARIRELLGEPEIVPYADARGAGLLCVDPSRRLRARHGQLHGVVAMSGTLLPLAHFRQVLGLDDAVGIDQSAPFPESNRCALVVPSVCTTWRERARHYDAIAGLIGGVVAVRPGHYAACFPSFRFLEEVGGRLALPGTIAQEPGMGPRQRDDLLARMRHDPAPLLLLCVTGGIFTEGVDLPGEALVGAIIVGPALPQVGFERSEMQRRLGFTHAMLYPGMRRVLQAAGRVHRTAEDRGVLVFLGRRFAERPYAACLPPHAVVADPVPHLEAFWGSYQTSLQRKPCL